MRARPCLGRAVAIALAAVVAGGAALAQQPRRLPPATSATPALSAARGTMAGGMLTVFVSRAPAGARLAIARPADPPEQALVSVALGAVSATAITVPGESGGYELRVLREETGKTAILLRQPLTATPATATLAAPPTIRAGAPFPARGIGPNGERDRVVIARPDATADTAGPTFFPAENVEATLEAPSEPGAYELRYVMDAPLTGPHILARRPLTVE